MQFSTRALLAAVAIVGIGAALWAAEPSWKIGILQTSMVLALPACVTVAAIQAGGASRPFCIGLVFATTIPAVIYLLQLANESCVLIVDIAAAGVPSDTSFKETQCFRSLSSASPLFKLAAGEWLPQAYVDEGELIKLDNTQVTDAGLTHLQGLTNLKEL